MHARQVGGLLAAPLLLFLKAGTALADSLNLPDPQWFQPELPSMEAGSAALAIIRLLNVVIGTIGVLMLAYASWPLLVYAWDILHGRQSKESMRSRGASLIGGITLLLLALTGAWYPLLRVIVQSIARTLSHVG